MPRNSLPIPPILLEKQKEIAACAEKQPAQRFDLAKWRDQLRKKDQDINLGFLEDYKSKGLTRGDVTCLAREAERQANPDHYRTLFLASMVWGYGYGSDRDKRGIQVGFGPFRTARILDKNENRKFDEILLEVSSAVRAKMRSTKGKRGFDENAIATAYDQLAYDPKVKWWGPAYFTKYLYFLGRGIDEHNYPLILDRKVATSFNTSLSAQFAKLEGSYVRPWKEGYMRYLRNMREWAGLIGCDADDIECFLYEHSAKK